MNKHLLSKSPLLMSSPDWYHSTEIGPLTRWIQSPIQPPPLTLSPLVPAPSRLSWIYSRKDRPTTIPLVQTYIVVKSLIVPPAQTVPPTLVQTQSLNQTAPTQNPINPIAKTNKQSAQNNPNHVHQTCIP